MRFPTTAFAPKLALADWRPGTSADEKGMEKRQSPRYQIEAPAIMRVQGRGPFVVTVLDVSATGVRLSSSCAFPEDTRVSISCGGANVTGTVRYSRPFERDFHIGILADGASAAAMSETSEIDLIRLFKARIPRR